MAARGSRTLLSLPCPRFSGAIYSFDILGKIMEKKQNPFFVDTPPEDQGEARHFSDDGRQDVDIAEQARNAARQDALDGFDGDGADEDEDGKKPAAKSDKKKDFVGLAMRNAPFIVAGVLALGLGGAYLYSSSGTNETAYQMPGTQMPGAQMPGTQMPGAQVRPPQTAQAVMPPVTLPQAPVQAPVATMPGQFAAQNPIANDSAGQSGAAEAARTGVRAAHVSPVGEAAPPVPNADADIARANSNRIRE
ncbi:MAG: hypothetical protein ING19_11325, partial [Azospirillum sp.]|nr:hypothetical protein [Azospirillum sp.]